MTVQIGDTYRDTYHDEPSNPGKRVIRIVGREPDGRWVTQTIIDHAGAAVVNGRKTKVKTATLVAGYELVSAGPSLLDEVIASLGGTRQQRA
jgi:hypothetical protein